eukprot:3322944-Prymnesium_polylepis.1
MRNWAVVVGHRCSICQCGDVVEDASIAYVLCSSVSSAPCKCTQSMQRMVCTVLFLDSDRKGRCRPGGGRAHQCHQPSQRRWT